MPVVAPAVTAPAAPTVAVGPTNWPRFTSKLTGVAVAALPEVSFTSPDLSVTV